MTSSTPLAGHPAPPTPPDVPGFAVHSLLGFGSHGEVWLGNDLVSGAVVALKIGRPPDSGPPTDESAGALNREIALLARIDDPHVVRLHRVVALEEGGHALVLEHAAGGNLGSLVASRGALDPPEVTTLLVPLGQALDRLHARGVVHGDLSPGNVLFAADGRPLLSDLGVARVLGTTGPGPHGTPGFVDPALVHGVDPRASDVWGLAALGWFALTGRTPCDPEAGRTAPTLEAPGLTRLLREVLDADPPERPQAAELAQQAWGAVRPAPIRLLPGRGHVSEADEALSRRTTRQMTAAVRREAAAEAPEERNHRVALRRGGPAAGRPPRPRPDPSPGRRQSSSDARAHRVVPRRDRPPNSALSRRSHRDVAPRRRRSRVLLPVTGVLGLVVLPAVAGFLYWGPDAFRSDAVEAPPPAAGPTSEELTTAITALGRARATAFATGSTQPLAAADEPGSPAMAYDTAVVQGLTARGWRLSGVGYAVRDVRVLRQQAGAATVMATVTTSAHHRTTPAGTLLAEVAAEPPRQTTLTLVQLDGKGWRVRAVS